MNWCQSLNYELDFSFFKVFPIDKGHIDSCHTAISFASIQLDQGLALYLNHSIYSPLRMRAVPGTQKRPDRAQIKDKWIKYVIDNSERIQIQSDGRIRKWAKITEVNKYLRVILLEDRETVHNAFFDRSYKEDE